MHQHNTRACTEEGIGGAHWGPVLAYMSAVDDAATADGSSEFFKIYQNTWKKNPAASQGDNDFWGTKDLNYNCGKLDFKIPEDIAPGDYLLRAEAIALHAASSSGGAQHYVTCYQLTVTGSGTLVPKGVKFPEAYSKTGPGLGFSIHADLSDYPAPGPALIASGTESAPQLLTFGEITGAPTAPKPVASSTKAVVASSAPAPASTTAAAEAEPTVAAPAESSAASSSAVEAIPTEAAPTTPEETSAASTPEETVVAPAPTSSAAAPSSSAAAPTRTASPVASAPTTLATVVRPQPTGSASNGTISQWARCGGTGFTGTGSCASGLICKDWNPYYSQCVKDDGAAAPAPAPAAPTATAPAAAEPTTVSPVETGDDEPTEKTYTLETFIAFLEQEAGGASAGKIRRMIEALQQL